ncbi:FAD/NAD-P-binding domain-containing protein [Lentinula boryana]|uniref:Electron transfer flavoprotein-ubiquinone oxidoreductase n=1 Tax=Lentinula boryana TaxID=40481 RepID=A0ABQ8QU17_9AGAR|nr:FAD/NAD-P-binding domain-containing protein [Lentinula boryana]
MNGQKVIRRLLSTNSRFNALQTPRATDSTDVLIVGAGPAGLAAAIRIKQLKSDLRVVVLEKGGEIGSHILSGCVLEPTALYDLLGKDLSTYSSKYGCGEPPLGVKAGKSEMVWLTGDTRSMIPGQRAIRIPHPPQMNNKGNYIISLSAFTRWLGRVAEEHYGVEVYPGFAGAGLVYSDESTEESPWVEWAGKWGKQVTGVNLPPDTQHPRVPRVLGVLTNDVGISKSYTPNSTYTPGLFFQSKLTLLAEGAHGSLSKSIIAKFSLRKESEPQTYGFGIKEVWSVNEGHIPGKIIHTLGFPLDKNTYGGGWIYHMDNNLISLGLVVGVDWENPYKSPYKDFQIMKHHPFIRSLLEPSTSTRLAYGARTLTEGGLQSLPLLHFPGGALIGDSAGTVNVAKIKGVHTAMGTGILAANAVSEALSSNSNSLSTYTSSFLNSPIHSELYSIRNLRPSFHFPSFTKHHLGVLGGILYSGIDSLFLKGRTPWTFKHTQNEEERKQSVDNAPSLDSLRTKPTSVTNPIQYPPFEPPLSTDLLTSLSLTDTFHEEDQPEHLRLLTLPEAKIGVKLSEIRLEDEGEEESPSTSTSTSTPDSQPQPSQSQHRQNHVRINLSHYAGLLERACPAGVYEYVEDTSSPSPPSQNEIENHSEESEDENKSSWKNKKLVINAQNCIHCKLCDIKVPSQDITWSVPEGGGGPKYTIT